MTRKVILADRELRAQTTSGNDGYTSGFQPVNFGTADILEFNVHSREEKGHFSIQFYRTKKDVTPFCAMTVGSSDNSEITFEMLDETGEPKDQLPIISYHMPSDYLSFWLGRCGSLLTLYYPNTDPMTPLAEIRMDEIEEIGAVAVFNNNSEHTLVKFVKVESNHRCPKKVNSGATILAQKQTIEDIIVAQTVSSSSQSSSSLTGQNTDKSKIIIIVLVIIIVLLLVGGSLSTVLYLKSRSKKSQ